MKKFPVAVVIFISFLLILGASFVLFKKNYSIVEPQIFNTPIIKKIHVFFKDFKTPQIIEESGTIEESENPFISVSSGAYLYIQNGIAATIQGELPTNDKWRIKYLKDNPIDTDDGFRPQNIFRMEVRDEWLNYVQQAYFKITKDNASDSPNRNQSNGLLFFNRYKDADNLYYTGIRVDGYADIKKKYRGIYYTLAHNKIIDGLLYDRDKNISLLPKNKWIGLKTEVENINNMVNIRFYTDIGKTGEWTIVASSTDDGKNYGGPGFLKSGFVGIRTDFMDVELDDYKIEEL